MKRVILFLLGILTAMAAMSATIMLNLPSGGKAKFKTVSSKSLDLSLVEASNNGSSRLIIPAQVDYKSKRYTVVRVEKYALKDCDEALRELRFPETIAVIESSIFLSKDAVGVITNAMVRTLTYGIVGAKIPLESKLQNVELTSLSISKQIKHIEKGAFNTAVLTGKKSPYLLSGRITELPDFITPENAGEYGLATSCVYAYKSGNKGGIGTIRELHIGGLVHNSDTVSEKKAPVSDVKLHSQTPTTSDVDVNLPHARSQCENTFAVIIANENYQRVPNVDYALNDGRTFRRYCHEVLGLPKGHVKIAEDATLGQMTELFVWLEQVSAAYKGEARVIVYYAGHGIPNAGNGSAYLLPVDVSGSNTRAAYSLDELYKELGALQAKSVTLFMDACFSGSNRGEGTLVADRGVGIKAREEVPQGNMVVFAAAQGSEAAWPLDSEKHGMFTYFLLKKLKESKGNVSLSQLGEYIVESVARKSAVANRKQTPSVSGAPSMGSDWKRMTLKD